MLRFLRLRQETDHGQYENFDFWIFQLNPTVKLEDDYFYLDAMMNGYTRTGFDGKNGVVRNQFVPLQHITAEWVRKKDIETDRTFQALSDKSGFLFNEPQYRYKLLRAVEFFSRSFSHAGRGVGQAEDILNIHTALEALLKTRQSERSVKAELMTGLLSLLGQRTELAQWFNSFYTLRNSLVHGDVIPAPFLYRDNRPHLQLAQRVFVACFDSIINTAERLPLHGFEEEVIPNKSRIDATISNLKSARKKSWGEIARSGLLNPLGRLRTDDTSSPKNQAVELGKLLLPHVRRELEGNNTEGAFDSAITSITTILNWSSDEMNRLALAYSNLEVAYQTAYFKHDKSADEGILRAAAHSFINYAAWRLFVMYRD